MGLWARHRLKYVVICSDVFAVYCCSLNKQANSPKTDIIYNPQCVTDSSTDYIRDKKMATEKWPQGWDGASAWPRRVLQNDLWASEKPLSHLSPSDVFCLCQAAVSSSSPLPHCPHSTPTTANRPTTITRARPTTPPPDPQHTLAPSQMEDAAMTARRARGWKLRPDATSNQGLITVQYISLYKFMCVCAFLFHPHTR